MSNSIYMFKCTGVLYLLNVESTLLVPILKVFICVLKANVVEAFDRSLCSMSQRLLQLTSTNQTRVFKSNLLNFIEYILILLHGVFKFISDLGALILYNGDLFSVFTYRLLFSWHLNITLVTFIETFVLFKIEMIMYTIFSA